MKQETTKSPFTVTDGGELFAFGNCISKAIGFRKTEGERFARGHSEEPGSIKKFDVAGTITLFLAADGETPVDLCVIRKAAQRKGWKPRLMICSDDGLKVYADCLSLWDGMKQTAERLAHEVREQMARVVEASLAGGDTAGAVAGLRVAVVRFDTLISFADAAFMPWHDSPVIAECADFMGWVRGGLVDATKKREEKTSQNYKQRAKTRHDKKAHTTYSKRLKAGFEKVKNLISNGRKISQACRIVFYQAIREDKATNPNANTFGYRNRQGKPMSLGGFRTDFYRSMQADK